MADDARKRLSKFLSYVLRHRPEEVGLELDASGWVHVDELIRKCGAAGRTFDRKTLDELVAASDKQRFAFDETGTRIRASQGHSVEVQLGYEPRPPPELLYHGTVAGMLEAIREHGLLKMQRHHVHLSVDQKTAAAVGGRRGKPVILTIRAQAMHDAGHTFMCSANGVWLTEHVPPEFIEFASGS